MFRILGVLAILSCDVEVEKADEKLTLNIQQVANYGNRGLRRSYESSVKVNVFFQGENYGSGSGNYFTHRGKKFIITSAHVVVDTDRVQAEERFGVEVVDCKVVYINEYYDIAILIPYEDFKTLKPVKYTWDYKLNRGEPVFFTGYPSQLEEISSYGTVAGQYAEFYVIQSVAWMGSSGSVVFNSRGQVVGVISGVKVGISPVGLPQIINNIIMVSPIDFLKERLLREILSNGIL